MIHSSACSELRDGPYFALNHSYSALLPRTRVPTRATAARASTATRIQLLSCPRVFGWVDSIDRSHPRPRTFSDLARLYPRGRRRQECDQAHEKRRLDLEKRRSVKVNANAKPARRIASRRSVPACQRWKRRGGRHVDDVVRRRDVPGQVHRKRRALAFALAL